MNGEEHRAAQASTALRDAFDRSFAEAQKPRAALSDFLAVRIGGDPYAISLSDIAALHRDRTIVPIPNRACELLGIAGFRGMTAPVYDLGALLGYGPAPAYRWLVLARAKFPVALAFELFEEHLRLRHEHPASSDQEKRTRHHVRGAVRAPHIIRPLINIASVLDAIARRVHPDGPPSKEP